MNIPEWERLFSTKILQVASLDDPAHDYLHFKRVVQTAKRLCAEENARLDVVLPAAWFHDFVIVSKSDPRRKQASRLSADAAVDYLRGIGYPEAHLADIAHAIAAHSYSANIAAETIEAQIVQDADRLDGLGAIGIARCFATAALMKRAFYSEEDPFCEMRPVDDAVFTIDHFYAKLFKTADTLKTASGRVEGARRIRVMQNYLRDFALEL